MSERPGLANAAAPQKPQLSCNHHSQRRECGLIRHRIQRRAQHDVDEPISLSFDHSITRRVPKMPVPATNSSNRAARCERKTASHESHNRYYVIYLRKNRPEVAKEQHKPLLAVVNTQLALVFPYVPQNVNMFLRVMVETHEQWRKRVTNRAKGITSE